jgi:multiple RNA-binding domain-containing protein 1
MFGTFGKIKRVLLPPAGTIAIVEFPSDHESEASNAWKGLAYKRLKDSVLYLEWAPEGLFDGVAPLNVSEPTLKQSQSATDKTQPPDTAVDHSDEENAPPGATLYIGNLSFATTSARLSSLFRHLPSFAFAKVATKADPKKPGELLSQGFGFVGFKDVDAAKKAMKGFGSGGDGLVLDGHVLKVSFAGRGKEEAEAGAGILSKEGKGKATKIIVKNLAFEVSKKELWELFRYERSLVHLSTVAKIVFYYSAHAQVKSVRLPNRADRRSRGFAFVDFATRKEAENAMDRLKHTHLLGRHLVMEWAEKEKGVEEMRLKTMLQFGDGAEGTTDLGRKDKLRLGLGAEVDSDVE